MANEPRALAPRAVWQSQSAKAFRLSPADIGVGIARLEAKNRRRFRFMYAVFAIEIVGSLVCLIVFSNIMQRLGAILTIAAMAFYIVQLRFHSERLASAAINVMKVVRPSLEFYRDHLERRRAFYHGRWLWSRLAVIAPGPLLLMYGGDARPTPASATLVSATTVLFVVCLLYSIARRYRIARQYTTRIQALDRLEENPR